MAEKQNHNYNDHNTDMSMTKLLLVIPNGSALHYTCNIMRKKTSNKS